MEKTKLLLTVGSVSILFLSNSFAKKEVCSITSPYRDAIKRIDEKEKRIFVVQEENLNGDKFKDFVIIDKDSCGAKGCSTLIYLSDGSDKCHSFAGQFFGFISINENDKETTKPLFLSSGIKTPVTLIYDGQKKQYEHLR